MGKKVLVLGGNFGGLTAALSIKHELQGDVDVTVVSASDRFLFKPSLTWLPFGKRRPQDITFPLAPTFEAQQVDFVHAAATHIDPTAQQVQTTQGSYRYDYLVVATGYRNQLDVIPGLEVANSAYTITTLEDAIHAGEGWRRFLQDPGPVVVGATQGAGCFGAAYEFLFNLSYQLKKAGLRRRVPLTYVTAEPFLGHFGIGGLPGGETLLGLFLKKEGIQAVTGTAMTEVAPGKLLLADGRVLDFAYAMIVPPFIGQQVVQSPPGLADAKGYVPVHDTYQSVAYPNIYAVGIAAAVTVPWTTAVPVGVPKTGFPTETQAHMAATNIAAQVRGQPPIAHKQFGDIPAVCVMDAGNNGVLSLADRMLPPRKAGVMIPGPQSHAAKLLFERYFLWKAPTRLRPTPLTTLTEPLDVGPAAQQGVLAGPGVAAPQRPSQKRAARKTDSSRPLAVTAGWWLRPAAAQARPAGTVGGLEIFGVELAEGPGEQGRPAPDGQPNAEEGGSEEKGGESHDLLTDKAPGG